MRRSFRSRERQIRNAMLIANESQTARVIVAMIATGREANSAAAFSPLILPRRNECNASKPSKFNETPFATACSSGPLARSAWWPRLSSRMKRGKINECAPIMKAIDVKHRYARTKRAKYFELPPRPLFRECQGRQMKQRERNNKFRRDQRP